MGWIGRVALVLALLLVLGWLVACESSIAPVEPPAAAAFEPAEVARGARLAGAGNCASCHSNGDHPLAGGRAIATPFGSIHATNISPDPQHGIGRWSLAAFERAMRQGVAPDGSHYYPAFPYTHYTRVSDADIRALYAWLMTRTAVASPVPANDLAFPFNIRAAVAFWKLLYFDAGRHVDDPEQSAAWNRGSYLANGLGHCSACHSPRSALGAEADPWAGALVNGWYAPALDARNASPVPWTRQAMHAYLRHGANAHHGVAMGDMATVVHDGLAALPDSDIHALATWFADLAGTTAARPPAGLPPPLPDDRADPGGGASLYLAACAGCHHPRGAGPDPQRPALASNTALTGPDPVNLLRALVGGVSLGEGLPHTLMPGYDQALSDPDIITLARWLRTRHAGIDDLSGRWSDLEGVLAEARLAGHSMEEPDEH